MTQRQLFLQHLAPTSDAPLGLEIERAEGIYLFDKTNKSYIDLIAGIGVSSLGHCHPSVVKAIQTQSERYLHTMVYGEYILAPQVQLAKIITDLLPTSLDSVYFTNSGTEATEGAMKLAKRITGRKEIISCFNSYHGSTQGAASLNSDDFYTRAYRPLLPNIKHIAFNNIEQLSRITDTTAAVIIETVQAEIGICIPNLQWIKALRKRCDEVGAILIFDEIQAGIGRTGKMFAFEHFNVIPDVILLAKGFGGGMPIGAFISSKKHMQTLSHNPVLGHITTFGGHPVSCAASHATIQTLLNSTLIEEAEAKGKLFENRLKNHVSIKEIRRIGLWMAVELESWDTVQKSIANCLKNGLITDWFLFNSNCLRIAPPLTITIDEIEKSCAILLDAIPK